MLKQLYIRNFTLIDELDMPFRPGFSVITGETGAGKSIILGAIGLLLGQRADSKTIKQGADKCIIEAHFDLSRYQLNPFFEQNDIEFDAHDTIIRRELTAAGKSRAFINDTPVALAVLKELGEQLVDVHSQHQNLMLSQQDFQLNVVDTVARDAAQLASYRTSYDAYQQAARRLQAMREDIERNRQNADFLQFQYDELVNAHLVDGEQDELEQRSDTMSHAEEIKQALYEAENICMADGNGLVPQLKRATSALRSIDRVYAGAAELAQRLESSYIEIKDVADELSTRLDSIDFDAAELEAVNSRLDRLYELQKKHHVESVAGLLNLQHDLQAKLQNIENGDEALQQLQRELATMEADCQAKARILTEKRQAAAKAIQSQMHQRLVPLGMPNVRFDISIEPERLGPSGCDRVSFLFSANTSTPLQPVAQVASGGEIARVMLSLKAMISGTVKLPTIIFDEIDTGVSGKTAEQMAQLMAEMGQNERQVISITHLPQIASLGTTHYKVYKEDTPAGTTSHMQLLTTDERVREIAQMLSGSSITDAAIQNARQLLRIDNE